MDFDRERPTVSRRKFLLAAAAGVSTLVLVRCGGPTNQGTTAGTPAAVGGTTPEAAATAAGAAIGEGTAGVAATEVPTATPVVLGTGNKKVVFWHGLGGADAPTLVQMLQQYASQKPEV